MLTQDFPFPSLQLENHQLESLILSAKDSYVRISLTTRTLVVGSVAATGLFSSLAASAQPGHSKAVRTAKPVAGGQLGYGTGTTAGTTPPTAPATTPTTQASSGGGDNLSQPTSPPATAPATTPATTPDTTPTYQYNPPAQQYIPPVVVSGAS